LTPDGPLTLVADQLKELGMWNKCGFDLLLFPSVWEALHQSKRLTLPPTTSAEYFAGVISAKLRQNVLNILKPYLEQLGIDCNEQRTLAPSFFLFFFFLLLFLLHLHSSVLFLLLLSFPSVPAVFISFVYSQHIQGFRF
jgi:hypothetical protein